MRLVLTVDSGLLAKTEFTLVSGVLTLGRDDTCAVRFASTDPDAGQVSRRHATLRAEDGSFRIVDEGSRNGTFVNGERVADARLANGDRIQLGSAGPRLRVEITQTVAVPEPPRPTAGLARPSLADKPLYDPTKDKGRRGNVVTGLAMGFLACAGLFLGLLGWLLAFAELGVGAALIGTLVAFIPAPLYLALWLWLDRYDPEPPWALAACVLWGGGAATFVAGIANTVAELGVGAVTGDAGVAHFVGASISAPIMEEGMKALAVFAIFLFLRREFDGVIDGIVYAGVVALGFATVENVLYYGRNLKEEGAGALLVVFFLRGILGPFGHSVYTAMTGIGFGLARESHNTAVKIAAPAVGFSLAVFLHSAWNTLAGCSGGFFLLLFLVIWMPLFFAFVGAVIWMGHRESQLIARMLEPEVRRGLLTAEQAATVCSWPKRTAWVLSSLGDLRRLTARRDFLYAATRLALSAWHVERAAAAGGMTMSLGRVPEFQADLRRLQSVV